MQEHVDQHREADCQEVTHPVAVSEYTPRGPPGKRQYRGEAVRLAQWNQRGEEHSGARSNRDECYPAFLIETTRRPNDRGSRQNKALGTQRKPMVLCTQARNASDDQQNAK